MNSIEVMARRKLIFKYISLGLAPADIHGLVEDKYPCSLKTVRRDIMSLGNWLPELVKIDQGESDEVLVKILGGLQLAQDRLLQLSFDGDNSSSMVGAIRSFASVLLQEAQLRMDAGIIRRAPFRAEFVDTTMSPEELEEFENKAFQAIGTNILAEEERQRRNAEQERDAGQESCEYWVGPREGLTHENEGRTEASHFDSPDSSQLRARFVDTSRNGSMAGGYIVKRRS